MNKDPPESKRLRMVQIAIEIANDSTYGYSQKPPSGRWGPDFDCSSLMYYIAHEAGYNVDVGSDKVRFTGTMLKDFEKAGFQVLPFANVGISDLKIGDILLNLALHAEVYVGNGESVSANSSEDGGYVGNSGDQTGHEISKHPVVTFNKDWDYVLRPPQEDEDEEEDNDYYEEGDGDVPMYNQPNQGLNGMYSPTTYNPQGYQQTGMNRPWSSPQGYPQGNLGQMNGYSQANAGMYPQSGMHGMQGYPQSNMMPPMGPQGMDTDLCYVMGIEGAKNLKGMPNSRKPVFDEDKALMYVVSFDYQGNVNNIRVFHFEECSEEMPQHLSPLMQHGNSMMGNQNGTEMGEDWVSREEFEQLKEMLLNDKSAKNRNESNGSRSGQQSNGGRLNARTN